MKQFYLILILATFAYANTLSENGNHIQSRVFEAKIKEKIEALLEKIGDPAKLENTKLQLEKDTLQLDLTATGTITGLKGLDITQLTLSLIGFKFNFEILLPKLDVDISSYDLTASLDMLPLYGAGTLKIKLQDVKIAGSGKLGSNNGLLFLEKINFVLSLDLPAFSFEITGWAHDDDRSKALSQLIKDVVQTLLTDYPVQTNQVLSDLLLKLTEGITFSLSDL